MQSSPTAPVHIRESLISSIQMNGGRIQKDRPHVTKGPSPCYTQKDRPHVILKAYNKALHC